MTIKANPVKPPPPTKPKADVDTLATELSEIRKLIDGNAKRFRSGGISLIVFGVILGAFSALIHSMELGAAAAVMFAFGVARNS